MKKEIVLAEEAVFNAAPSLEVIEKRFPVRTACGLLDASDPFFGYSYRSPEFLSFMGLVRKCCSDPEFREYLNLCLIFFAKDFFRRYEENSLPEEFLIEFERNIKKTLRGIAIRNQTVCFSLESDVFWKELGIVRQVLIPCVSHLIYRFSGVPRRVFFAHGSVRKRAKVMADVFFRCGGFRPFMENHVHPLMLEGFNEHGREQCFRLVAQLLERWPESRGLVGSSWYYDEALGAVSPNLAYLHQTPAGKGAFFLDLGESEQAKSDASQRSAKRHALIDAGVYRPRNVMMIWGRREIIRAYGG